MLRAPSRGFLWASASALSIAAMPAVAQADIVMRQFEIPAQSAETAIGLLGRQGDVQIIASRKITRALRTNEVRGRLTVADALDRMFAGTGFAARRTGPSTWVVVARGLPAEGQKGARPIASAARLLDAGEAPAATEAGPAAISTGRDAGGEDIVVTARHRDERLVDVPQSITALGALQLEQVNARRYDDYIGRIPNLSVTYGANLFGLSETRATVIRGVQGVNTTSYYIDDTPVPDTVSPQVLDIDRIEVLRGPQGTLFGASSMGGSLRFITKQPNTSQPSYRVRAYGGFTAQGGSPDFGGEAAANVVLGDSTAVRALVQYDHQSGFIRKQVTGNGGTPVVRGNQGQPSSLSGSFSLLHRFDDRWSLNLVGILQFQDIEGLPIAYAPLPGFTVQSVQATHRNDFREFQKDHWGFGAATLKYKGEGWGLSSSTSYFRRDSTYQEDATEATTQSIRNIFGADLNYAPAIWSDFYRTTLITHESRVNFDRGTLTPWLSGVAGFYFQHQQLKAVSAGADKQPLTVAGLSSATGFWPNDVLWNTRYGNHANNYALFGELYLQPVEKVQLTLGLRKYWIDSLADPIVSNGLLAFTSGTPIPFHQTGYVPRIALSYKVAPNANLYASYSKGFRAGGSQPGLPASCDADLAAIGRSPGSIRTFGSDNLNSYEVGFKSSSRRFGVEAAAFQIDWSGIQQIIPLPCGYQFSANAGKARIRGGELALSHRPVPELPLTVSLGLGYLDARLTDPASLPQPAGSRINLVPEWTGNASVFYEQPLSRDVTGFVGMDANYTSSVRTANVIPTAPLQRPAITMLNARIGARFDRSEVSLSFKNLLNRKYNLGDVRSSAFELYDATGTRVPRVAVARPFQVEVQYVWRY